MPETTLGCTPLRRNCVVRLCRKSCQPPILIPSSLATGLTYRFRAFPGLTGIPSCERKIHSPSPSFRIRNTNSGAIGSLRMERSDLALSSYAARYPSSHQPHAPEETAAGIPVLSAHAKCRKCRACEGEGETADRGLSRYLHWADTSALPRPCPSAYALHQSQDCKRGLVPSRQHRQDRSRTPRPSRK